MAPTAPRYPEPPVRPVQDTIGGVSFVDPYRWLEDDTPETLAWQAEQDRLAAAYLHEWSGFAPLRASLAAGGPPTVVAPERRGAHWFHLVQRDPAGPPVLCVSASPAEPGRVLVDPAGGVAGSPATLDWVYPSPSGRYVAYGLSERGDEQSVLHLVETETGRVLPDRIPHMMAATVAWLPDDSGFYYNAGRARSTEGLKTALYRHRVGEAVATEPEPVPARDGQARPQVSDDGRYVAMHGGNLEPRPDYLLDTTDGRGWRPFLRDAADFCSGVFVGDDYIAVMTDGAPRGRLVRIPVATGEDRSTWRELIPEGEPVLQNVVRAGDRLVLGELVNVTARLRLLALDGTPVGEVPLPGVGVVAQTSRTSLRSTMPMVAGSAGSDQITFVYQSLTVAPAAYRYDLSTGELVRLTAPEAERGDWTQRQLFATSKDGTRVSVFVVHRADLDLSRPQPAVMYAYGGFISSSLPGYHREMAPLVDAGGIYAIVNARGGAEYGRDWWQGGRMARKENTFDDVAAAAEHLIAEGLTAADRLGLYGLSNGGLMAGAAITRRPDLFQAVVPLVPILDLMRMIRDRWTEDVAIVEYGTSRNPEQAPILFRYSPVHNVRPGVAYPAVLVVAGQTDVRCQPWHSRKFVALLQANTASDRPVLYRVLASTGHMTGMSAEQQATATAEWLGFLMNQIGLKPAPAGR